jgi:hypothetical protein
MKKAIIITIIAAWMGAAPALAGGEKMGETADIKQDAAFMKKMPGKILLKKNIDGYTVHFYVMKAEPGMEMGGSHDFMIKVEKDGVAIKKLIARSKVIHPDGKSEKKMMMMMGYWYMSGFDLGHEGQHQLMALFKTADGVKHFGGIYYPEAGKSDN